jgi:hypothetical protein
MQEYVYQFRPGRERAAGHGDGLLLRVGGIAEFSDHPVHRDAAPLYQRFGGAA